VNRLVVDLGNTRFKWARLDSLGRVTRVDAFPLARPDLWEAGLEAAGILPGSASWWISSVTPAAAVRLAELIEQRGDQAHWYRSAADVGTNHRLVEPERAGADRALAVWGALARFGREGPGQVVACGTAITVEVIDQEGCWRGGAIAPGLATMGHALRDRTEQLPAVIPTFAPKPCGESTEPALAAGIFWGAVGTIRELLARQAEQFGFSGAWIVWTGGDAGRLAPHVSADRTVVCANLVLEALGSLAHSTRH
jgi:type III pantothenate kinase